MIFSNEDSYILQEIMSESPRNQEIIQKLLDYQQYTISKIGHEIRNPLSLVYSTLQLIESTHPEITDIKHWDFMKQDVEFMKELLEELSTFNNGDRLTMSVFNFRTFIEHIALSFATTLVDENIEFTSQIAPDLPDITGDKIKLKEVFLNLLRNAREAVTPPGSIYLSAAFSEGQVVVQIRDTGCGIDASLQEQIFTPFVTNKQSGTGLGLSIARKTVLAHNGQIKVSSVVDSGTTFSVTLPVQ